MALDCANRVAVQLNCGIGAMGGSAGAYTMAPAALENTPPPPLLARHSSSSSGEAKLQFYQSLVPSLLRSIVLFRIATAAKQVGGAGGRAGENPKHPLSVPS